MREGWEYKKLGDYVEVINGLWTGKKEPFVNVAVIRNTNFSKDCRLKLDDVAFIDVEKKQFATRKLKYGDIIIEKSGGSEKQPVGRPVLFDITEGDFSFSNFTATLRIKEAETLSPMFLHKCLFGHYVKGETLKMQSKTTGLHNLDMKAFLRLPIPCLPLSEQQRIVSELDLLTSIIDKQKEQLKELDTLAQSIFYDMFGDPVENEKGWEVKKLGEACSLKAGKAIKAEELDDTYQYPCFGGNGIRGFINKCSHTVSSPIIGRQGAYCGTVNFAVAPFYATEHAVVVKMLLPLDTKWLFYTLTYLKLSRFAKGQAQPGIAVGDLCENVLVPLPPLSLQQTFAAKIEAIEKQKAAISSSLAETQKLFDYTMDKYFG